MCFTLRIFCRDFSAQPQCPAGCSLCNDLLELGGYKVQSYTQERAALSPRMVLYCFVSLSLLQMLVYSGMQQTGKRNVIKKVITKFSYVNTSSFLGRSLE